MSEGCTPSGLSGSRLRALRLSMVKSGLLDSAKTLTESRKHNNGTFKIKALKHAEFHWDFLLHIRLLYLSPNYNDIKYKTSLVSAFRNFPKQSQDVEIRLKETFECMNVRYVRD